MNMITASTGQTMVIISQFEYETLKQENTNLKLELARMVADSTKLHEILEQNAELRKIHEISLKEIELLKEENSLLRAELEKFKQRVGELEVNIVNLKSTIVGLESKIVGLKSTVDGLKFSALLSKLRVAMQDINVYYGYGLEQTFNSSKDGGIKRFLRKIHNQRLDQCPYILDNTDSDNEINYKLSILVQKIESLPPAQKDKFGCPEAILSHIKALIDQTAVWNMMDEKYSEYVEDWFE